MNSPVVTPPPIIADPDVRRKSSRSLDARYRNEKIFRWMCRSVASISVLLLVVILGAILWQGAGTLSATFLKSPPSPTPAEAGFYPAIMGTVWLLVLVAMIALPLGVATAIFLEEFKPRRPLFIKLSAFLQANITNLAGVPSVVYGIVGLTAFVSMFQLFGNPATPKYEWGIAYYDQFYNEGDYALLVPVENTKTPFTDVEEGMKAFTPEKKELAIHVIGPDDPWPADPELARRTLRDNEQSGRISQKTLHYFRIPFGRGILAGALTLMLVILPIVIIASQEALRAVPNSLREAALGLGATRWRIVREVTLPAAMPGIMTGAILAMSRAIGEAAPLLMIAGIVFISNAPGNIMDDFTAMPLQIYNWAQRPQQPFHEIAASGIIVLLAVLLIFNAVAIYIRHRLKKPLV